MKIDYPSENQIPQLKKLWGQSFPDPESFIAGFFQKGFSRDRCRCMMAEGGAAAALYWFDAAYKGQKMAYIYAVATDPQYRGRGLCRRLMGDTHELLRARGYAACLLLPGEPGLRNMYAGFGYRECCETAEFSCTAGEGIPLAEISWEEYAALRSDLLPEDGAAQEGLEFLSTYARFYQGQDFVAAGAKEEEAFLGLELLGNGNAAPGILWALNCRKGTFRTPGKGKKTVMCLPLREGVEVPGYVGLTFD